MTTPPPRKFFRFQIHLSTAIVLMFVAGALIWANVRASSTPVYVEFPYKICPNPDGFGGWIEEIRVRKIQSNQFGWPLPTVKGTLEQYWNRTNIAMNVLVALTILFAVWFVLEWLIRRRAARK